MEQAIAPARVNRKRSLSPIGVPTRFVANGTTAFATGKPQNADTVTSVPIVAEATRARNVRRRIETSSEYMRPRFAQDFIWGDIGDDISPAAHYSLLAEPLPRPPESELENIIANETIRTHPELFKITCNM